MMSDNAIWYKHQRKAIVLRSNIADAALVLRQVEAEHGYPSDAFGAAFGALKKIIDKYEKHKSEAT
jgi:hypothetical protein